MSLLPQSNFLLNALPLLLHDHDCLVIPGMGGFVAHPVPARFDEDKGEWIPPGRDVLFNPKLTVRDGLLEQEIRRATGCSNEAATEWLTRETEALHSVLQSGQHATLSGLGRLYRTEDGTLGFVAEPRLGERYAAPGLIRIAWPDHDAQPIETTDTTDTTDTTEKDGPTVIGPVSTQTETEAETEVAQEGTPFTQRVLKIAAVLALPALVTGTLWWNQQHTTGFDLGLSSTPIETPFAPRIEGEDIRFPELDLGNPLPFIEAGAPDLPNPLSTEAHMPVPIPGSTASGCGHHVIAGTFADARRAATLARRFDSLGYTTSILPGPDGMQRVSAGCFQRSSDAARFRRALVERHGFNQAWILNL